jgi:Integrase core domain
MVGTAFVAGAPSRPRSSPHSACSRRTAPNHPQTCGKVERFQQTLKKWLTRQPAPGTLRQLQAQLDTFRDYYNHRRPRRALGRSTTRHARRGLCRPQGHPPPASPPATTGSAATAWTTPARSPCATTAGSTTSAAKELESLCASRHEHRRPGAEILVQAICHHLEAAGRQQLSPTWNYASERDWLGDGRAGSTGSTSQLRSWS